MGEGVLINVVMKYLIAILQNEIKSDKINIH